MVEEGPGRITGWHLLKVKLTSPGAAIARRTYLAKIGFLHPPRFIYGEDEDSKSEADSVEGLSIITPFTESSFIPLDSLTYFKPSVNPIISNREINVGEHMEELNNQPKNYAQFRNLIATSMLDLIQVLDPEGPACSIKDLRGSIQWVNSRRTPHHWMSFDEACEAIDLNPDRFYNHLNELGWLDADAKMKKMMRKSVSYLPQEE